MKCFINGQEYKYINDALKDKVTRMSYFKLTKQIVSVQNSNANTVKNITLCSTCKMV